MWSRIRLLLNAICWFLGFSFLVPWFEPWDAEDPDMQDLDIWYKSHWKWEKDIGEWVVEDIPGYGYVVSTKPSWDEFYTQWVAYIAATGR